MARVPDSFLIESAKYAGLPYVWGGTDLASGVDCSGFVLGVYARRGLAIEGARTAEQIRQVCVPIGWDDVQPGDLLFVDYPEDRVESPASDGYAATHVAISFGVGSRRAWSAQEPVVKQVDLNSDWWQNGLFEARRHPYAPQTLPTTPDLVLGFEALWPEIELYSSLYGVDARHIAGVCKQESGFKNYRVHADGTGHGLFGFDDSGGLIEFERWSRLSYGRGPSAGMISPALQVEFVCSWFESKIAHYGSIENAERVWHRGPSLWDDARGAHYGELIAAHVHQLFG